MTENGIDRILADSKLLRSLGKKRVALLGHPASVTRKLDHSLYALHELGILNLSCAFGPQHGMLGEKQDNMIESEDYRDPRIGIPVFSLYSSTRRPTAKMMDAFDVLFVDLQDVGCRVYTYLTTLRYMLEAAAQYKKEVWVLDRPNPIGRPAEGFLMDLAKWESFVGASRLPMRHGLTMGELARWLIAEFKLDVPLKVIEVSNYKIDDAPDYGWPAATQPWVNPSPNMPTLDTARCYPGTVLLEGTLMSEGRGTTRPLQIFGAPAMNSEEVIKRMFEIAPQWMAGCKLRPCFFEPTFHKFQKTLCAGVQIHLDADLYSHHKFQPYRLMLLLFKAFHQIHPEFSLWRQPPYEYETVKLPIDLLNGNEYGRLWVDDPKAPAQELESRLQKDEKEWLDLRRPHLLYS